MKTRAEYAKTIEYLLPVAECPEDPDECWEFLCAVFNDVYAKHPDAGITVTRHPSRYGKDRQLLPPLPHETVRRLEVKGVDRSEVQKLLEESERAHKHS